MRVVMVGLGQCWRCTASGQLQPRDWGYRKKARERRGSQCGRPSGPPCTANHPCVLCCRPAPAGLLPAAHPLHLCLPAPRSRSWPAPCVACGRPPCSHLPTPFTHTCAPCSQHASNLPAPSGPPPAVPQIPDSQKDVGSNHAVSALKFRILQNFMKLGYAVLLSGGPPAAAWLGAAPPSNMVDPGAAWAPSFSLCPPRLLHDKSLLPVVATPLPAQTWTSSSCRTPLTTWRATATWRA